MGQSFRWKKEEVGRDEQNVEWGRKFDEKYLERRV